MTDHFRELLHVYRLSIEEICRLTGKLIDTEKLCNEYYKKLVALGVFQEKEED